MKAQQQTFYEGQAVAANTYVGIMVNAFWLIKLEAKPEDFKESEFDDFITLAGDKTQSKTELANYINDLVVESYQGEQGAYLKEDLKDVKSKYTAEWLTNISNKALETVHALSDTTFSIVM